MLRQRPARGRRPLKGVILRRVRRPKRAGCCCRATAVHGIYEQLPSETACTHWFGGWGVVFPVLRSNDTRAATLFLSVNVFLVGSGWPLMCRWWAVSGRGTQHFAGHRGAVTGTGPVSYSANHLGLRSASAPFYLAAAAAAAKLAATRGRWPTPFLTQGRRDISAFILGICNRGAWPVVTNSDASPGGTACRCTAKRAPTAPRACGRSVRTKHILVHSRLCR